MKIGVPNEHVAGECRVASTPEVAKKLVSKGFTVLVEDGAGTGSHYSNKAFEEAGATIVDKGTAFSADIVVKVRKPTVEEVNLMREGATGIGFIESCEDDDVHLDTGQ